MSSGEAIVKKFNLPGRKEDFLMLGEFVYRADTKEQVFARGEDGTWVVVRKAYVHDPEWLKILDETFARS